MAYAVHSEQRWSPVCAYVTRRLSVGGRFRVANAIGAMVIAGAGFPTGYPFWPQGPPKGQYNVLADGGGHAGADVLEL
jgi:hypothetical protein